MIESAIAPHTPLRALVVASKLEAEALVAIMKAAGIDWLFSFGNRPTTPDAILWDVVIWRPDATSAFPQTQPHAPAVTSPLLLLWLHENETLKPTPGESIDVPLPNLQANQPFAIKSCYLETLPQEASTPAALCVWKNICARAQLIASDRRKLKTCTHKTQTISQALKTARSDATELQAHNERYTSAIYGATDGIWDWHIQKQNIYFSPRWLEMLGYTATETSSDVDPKQDFSNPITWKDRIHPDDAIRMMALLRAHLKGKSPYFEAEYRCRRADQSFVWVLSRGKATRDDTGWAIRISGAQTLLGRTSVHDPHTGLPNRHLFSERLTHLLTQSQDVSSKHPGQQIRAGFSVLFIGFDHLQAINQTKGPSVGDDMLLQAVARLKIQLMPGDLLARISGDQCAIIATRQGGLPEAERLAQTLISDMARPIALTHTEVWTTLSIGIAPCHSHYTHPDQILRDGEAAMSQAQGQGGGRHQVFDASMLERAVARMRMEGALRRAITDKELHIHYQPVVDLKNRATVSFEALVRWEHPERGAIPPSEFIPVAEDMGLVIPMGAWIFEEACKQLVAWHAQWPGPEETQVSVAINLSVRQFEDPQLVPMIKDILGRTGAAARYLKIEITESVILEESAHTQKTLNGLKALGLSLVIDDFGTGYASLSYLHRMPIDAIKIDRAFVQRMHGGTKSHEIVRAIVHLARALELDVIAEGIEDEEQCALLNTFGAQNGQGYLFDRPLSPREAWARLQREALGFSKP